MSLTTAELQSYYINIFVMKHILVRMGHFIRIRFTLEQTSTKQWG